jgi:hypothetical protein
LPKEEKIQWVFETLGQTNYSLLSREDKGFMRRYLQEVTGYSRAQVARHIAEFQKQSVASEAAVPVQIEEPAAAPTQPEQAPEVLPARRLRVSWKHGVLVGSVAVVLLTLTSWQHRPTADVLTFLNGQDTTVDHLTSVTSAEQPFAVRTTTGDQTALFVGSTKTVALGTQSAIQQTTLASDAASLLRSAQQRRAARMNVAQPQVPMVEESPAIHHRIFSDDTQQLHSAAATPVGQWDPGIAASDGQILMIENGKPVWKNFPYLNEIPSAPRGAAAPNRASEYRGGGGPESSTVTNVTNNTVSNVTNTTIVNQAVTSGATIHAEQSLTTSGALVFEGAASGSSLYIATSLQGAGLSS